jgi:hypothetical protein
MPEGQRASATAIQNHVWHLQTRNPLGNGYADAMRKVEGSPDPSGREPVSHSDDSDDGETRDEQCSHRFQGLKAKLKHFGQPTTAAELVGRRELHFLTHRPNRCLLG